MGLVYLLDAPRKPCGDGLLAGWHSCFGKAMGANGVPARERRLVCLLAEGGRRPRPTQDRNVQTVEAIARSTQSVDLPGRWSDREGRVKHLNPTSDVDGL